MTGKCGNGPNVALSPDEIVLSHVATPATMARVLSELGGFAIDAAILKATEVSSASFYSLSCDEGFPAGFVN
jgi:hypothetical protein